MGRFVKILGLLALVAVSACAASPRGTWTDPVTGMTFVRISPGAFEMGSPAGEPDREPQETSHPARVDRAFWLGAHEVTQDQWLRVMDTNPSHFTGDGRRPVEEITWHDVQEFLTRLNASSPDGRFRLPTEAEWEYACRAGTTTPFGTGTSLDRGQANVAADIEDSMAGRGATTRVGSFAPNAWGLYDMHGNVWEWTADDHCPYPAGDHQPPACGGPLKVIRGGSWYYEADSARCALRYTHRPQDRGFSLGFRVARSETRQGGAP